jgi:nicotinamidase-related amidase
MNFLDDSGRSVLERGHWAQQAGFGDRPALLVVDVQYYMVGMRGRADNETRYPFSCGEAAFAAVEAMKQVLAACRAAAIPVIFTRFVIDPSGSDAGLLHSKIGRGTRHSDNLYFNGTHGAEILADLQPLAGEPVIDKNRKSAFFKTPLRERLAHLGIDTCIVIGGSTSGCVRATVVDAEQHDLRVIVPEEAVFDRVPKIHDANLFDMNRSSADVVPTARVLAYIATRAKA